MPTLLYGVCGNTASPVGITNDQIKVYQGNTVGVKLQAIGTADIGGQKTIPTLLYGATGPDALAIQVTGGRMIVDVAGETLKVDNASNTHLIVQATGGSTLPSNNALNFMPSVLYGKSNEGNGMTLEAITVSGGMMEVIVGAATCITFDVSVNPGVEVFPATADAGIMNRYIHVAGPTSHSQNHGQIHGVPITGKVDGSTYPYPIGITTAGIGGSGGHWYLMVTGETEVKTWSAGTLTVQATALDVRGLTAIGGKDIVGVVGVSNSGEPVWTTATGGTGGNAGGNLAVHSTVPSLIFGVCAGSGVGGKSAAAVGITGADMLHVGIGHDVKISASSADPIFITATGGLSASSGANSTAQLYNTVPSLILGLSGASGAPIGVSADMLKVYLDDGISAGRDSISVAPTMGLPGICGSRGTITAYDTMPVLMHGVCGAGGGSAAPIGMSGDAMNVNLVNAGITVDVTIGTHVEVKNDAGGPLRIAGACAAGACGGENPYPVSVASNYLGESVFVQGTGGMSAIVVQGFSADNDYSTTPIGVTSGNIWSMASDEALIGTNGVHSTNGIGGTLDNIYNIIANGLLGDDPVGTPVQKFATQSTLAGMAPDASDSTTKIANGWWQAEHNIHLANISSAYGATAEGSMNVNVISFPQPSAFVQGQQTAGGVRTQLNLGAEGFTTCKSGVKIKGHQNNSDYVYIGNSEVDVSNGYPLGPSEEIFLEIDQIGSVYIIASPSGTACYIAS